MTTGYLRGLAFGVEKQRVQRVSILCRRTVVVMFVITTCVDFRDTQAQVLNEYEAKAAFLFNFVKFVEWPSRAFANDDAPLVIGVVGDDRHSEMIDRVISGKTANGRRLIVKRFAHFKQLTQCHIVFVRSSENERIQQTLAAAGPGALTVGETNGFARSGGVINFITAHGKLQLEINKASAERAGLKISAKLLSLANVIRN